MIYIVAVKELRNIRSLEKVENRISVERPRKQESLEDVENKTR